MNAGTLEVDIAVGLARLQQDMSQAVGIVGRGTAAIDRAAGVASAALAGLGVGLSGAALVAFVRNAAEAADQLGKMSQMTGIAVAELSKLKYAAGLSDVDIGTLGKGMKALSSSMVEAGTHTSKAAGIFQAMGVGLAGGPKKALEEIADVFAGLADGEVKTTLATELFGKAGMQMIPLLNQGSAGLRTMSAEAERLGLVLNEETTKAAEQFNDNLRAVKASSEATAISLFNSLAPSLTRITAAMKEAAMEGGGLQVALVAIGGAMSEALGLNATVDQKLLRDLRSYRAELQALKEMDVQGLLFAGDRSRIAELENEIKKLERIAELRAAQNPFAGGVAGGSAVNSRAIQDALGHRQVAQAAKEEADADAHLIAYRRELWELSQSMNKAILDGVEAQRAYMEEIAKQTKAEEFANDTRGMTKSQIQGLIIARLEEQQAIMRANGAMEQDLQLLQNEIEARRKLQGAMVRGEQLDAQAAALREQAMLWGQVGDAAGNFFSDLVQNGSGAFDHLRADLKHFLAELVAIFAKRWILQLAAGLTGSSALAAAAGGVGQGTLAGGALSAFGATGAGGFLGEFGAAAMGNFVGPAAAGSAASMGGAVYGALAAIPVWGWALAAMGALAYAFRDKGENWQGQLGFGANAHAYTNSGPFGAEGFNFVQGQDATNRAMQAFFASTGGLDRQLASGLSAEQIARITGNLGGAYGTRADGQPSTFAFGEGDSTAAQQFTLEYLKKKYGTIFDEIDHTFAEFIRNYTGDSGELLASIGDFAAVMEALQDSPIPGLDIEALRALQREGEKLSDTFNRVTGAWATYASLFYSQEEQHAMGMEMLKKQFEALGLVMPTTREGFRALVESLEQGSPLWLAVIGMAQSFSDLVPAINSVADAARTVDTAMSPQAQFLAGNYGSAPWGGTWFGGSGSSGSSSSGGSDIPYGGMYGPGGSAYGGGGGYGPPPAPGAPSDLIGWLAGALGGNNLSPLPPEQQLEVARQAWLANPTAATSNAYLSIARQLYGSTSAYNSLFHEVYDANAGVVGAADYNTRIEQLQQSHLSTAQQGVNVMTQISVGVSMTNDLLQTIIDGAGSSSSGPAVAMELR